ncbi:heparan N-sulfatase [Fulvitalea axinellae]|uniref:Heparan N-sulfatase n=1 Tax=Fulvitalea axinellae TaxID=1182444 RepID=A0AAU9DBJ0_9BACT|nr:heparan N-sulfatase [Fulvitalea axinellae]
MKKFWRRITVNALAGLTGLFLLSCGKTDKKPLNILLITADDLNYNSVGAFGSKIDDITPNLDRLASQGKVFNDAHVTIAVCQPSRGVLMTGKYPHRNGIPGFHKTNIPDLPTLPEELQKGGYAIGLLGKMHHSSPKSDIQWDVQLDGFGSLGLGRDPERYYEECLTFLNKSKEAGKPFFLMANSHDPHRPFALSDQEQWAINGKYWNGKVPRKPSRVYKPEEVNVPDFLPDLQQVRLEMAEYYTSVHRLDETVGRILDALEESGMADNTLVMFLSDNGMAFPFAKTNCYLNSTRTPWIVRWPGVVKAGTSDSDHGISGVDYMATVLDAVGLPEPSSMDGHSFLPLLEGDKQEGREFVYTQFNETSARRRFTMRCVQDGNFGYIFSPWSDGKLAFKNESQHGRTFKAMRAAADSLPEVATRVKLFENRVVEEFYDLKNDPDALKNLANDPLYKQEKERFEKALEKWMVEMEDPALEAFRKRNDPEALKAFMDQENKDAKELSKMAKGHERMEETRRW